MNRLTVKLALLILVLVLLSGCSAFDKTYVVEADYPLAARKEVSPDDTLTVSGLSDLRDGIRSVVADGLESRTILFDASYAGNPAEDLAAACWQVRTEDALCIYCVENIAYELTQIVSVTEAKISITYSPKAIPVADIVSMPYATELNECIADAISSGRSKMAILISRSTLTAEDMAARFSEVYRKNPGLSPVEPSVSVVMFSGNGTQGLYEVEADTGLTAETFQAQKEAMDSLAFEPEEGANELTLAENAAKFLLDACHTDAPGTVYSALIEKNASPEGIALAYVELCRRSGLDCRIVYGQKDWQDHCWNIVRIDGEYYHVDLFAGMDNGFLKNDSAFWGSYRWAVNEYPKCNGSNEI